MSDKDDEGMIRSNTGEEETSRRWITETLFIVRTYAYRHRI